MRSFRFKKLREWLNAIQWKRSPLFAGVCILCILLIYAGLLLPTVGRQGISWDEQTDIEVTRAYLKSPAGWLVGSNIDPSQTRLPSFTVALVYVLFHRSDLYTARLVSCLVGALTLLGVFFYCAKRFNRATGLLACFILALSPFFLAFARVAFTETDIYLACILAWLLVFVDRMQDQASIGRSAVVGILLGLSMSAKFTALAVFPAVWFVIREAKKEGGDQANPPIRWYEALCCVLWEVLFVIGGIYAANKFPPGAEKGIPLLTLYLIVFSGWLFVLAYTCFRRQHSTFWWVMVSYVTGLALLTFLVAPPEHLTNPGILQSLYQRFRYDKAPGLFFPLEAGALHVLSIFFKSSLGIGAGLLAGLILSTRQWRQREFRFPVLSVWLYLGCLALLPLAQTFYTVPLLPILSILSAHQFIRLFERRKKLAMVLGGVAAGLLIFDLVLCYPDFNLNGYQWLGERVLAGRASVGYRSVVQTPSDGVEQAIQWLNEHAGPGERVRAYLLPWHIVQAAAPHPVYRLENGLRGPVSADPDYVVVEINAQIRQSWWTDTSKGDPFRPPYDPDWLALKYMQVFTVQRAFGLVVASVYHKK